MRPRARRWPAADAERALRRCVGRLVREDRRSPGSARSGRRRTPASECGRSRCCCASCVAKSGCGEIAARRASVRPVMVNSACTPPSGLPSALLTKRASRTGPLAADERRHRVLVAPSLRANATCGLTAGLVPPMAGCVAARRSCRGSSSGRGRRRRPLPREVGPAGGGNTRVQPGISPASGAPAPARPERGPGSRGPLHATDGGAIDAPNMPIEAAKAVARHCTMSRVFISGTPVCASFTGSHGR